MYAAAQNDQRIRMPSIEALNKAPSTHRAAFLKNWLQDPLRIASVVPSSRALARLMTADVVPGARVIELGVGTGTLTQAMLENGVDPARLHLVELNGEFVKILRKRFPSADVRQVDATDLSRHLSSLAGQVDFVISGLPMAWFKRETKLRMLGDAFELLRPGGRFYQFTYLVRPPVGGKVLAEIGLTATLAGFTALNVPPAFVYRFERARPRAREQQATPSGSGR